MIVSKENPNRNIVDIINEITLLQREISDTFGERHIENNTIYEVYPEGIKEVLESLRELDSTISNFKYYSAEYKFTELEVALVNAFWEYILNFNINK